MAWPPQISDFKAWFTREFIYGSGGDTVTDGDITRALAESNPLFNRSLFDLAADQKTAFLYLAAHCLVLNIQAAGGLSATARGRGVRNGSGNPIQSKGVGPANVTYALPESIQNSRVLGQFMRTDFGQRYLQLIAPRLVGHMAVVAGPGAEDPTDPTGQQ